MAEKVTSPEVISLKNKPGLVIGSSYKSDIFYQFHNRIPEKYAYLYPKEDAYCYKKIGDGNERILKYGDEIRIDGLWIYYLGGTLLLHAYEGDMRVALRKNYAAF